MKSVHKLRLKKSIRIFLLDRQEQATFAFPWKSCHKLNDQPFKITHFSTLFEHTTLPHSSVAHGVITALLDKPRGSSQEFVGEPYQCQYETSASKLSDTLKILLLLKFIFKVHLKNFYFAVLFYSDKIQKGLYYVQTLRAQILAQTVSSSQTTVQFIFSCKTKGINLDALQQYKKIFFSFYGCT